jgi:putative ubiquitin-RnfH superfamily antitoxin RatB of RatAB toxin-antitoxin module
MPDDAPIRVSVVCAAPDRVFLRELDLPRGASVRDAIEASGIHQAWPEVQVVAERLGVFARKADFTTLLNDGDRVEIYRPLKIDPKDARRKRARTR